MKKKILFCFLTFLGVFIIRNTYYHIVKPVFFSIITYDNPSPKFYLDLTSKYKLINSLETMVTSDYILNENHNKLYIKEKNKKINLLWRNFTIKKNKKLLGLLRKNW